MNQTIQLVIKNISILSAICKSPELYRPVYKLEQGAWERLPSPVQIVKDQDIELRFDFAFVQSSKKFVYFAFSYPFSYQE